MKYLQVLFILIFFLSLFGDNVSFITVQDVIDMIQNKFTTIQDYEAEFTIVNKTDASKSSSGKIFFKNPSKLLMEFYKPIKLKGQKIITDGTMLWIYIPYLNIVGEQVLSSSGETELMSGMTARGLGKLIRDYHYQFDDKATQPANYPDLGKAYTILLYQRVKKSGFRYIKLWVNEDGLIIKSSAVGSNYKKLIILFRNIKLNQGIDDRKFTFQEGSNVQIIHNPLMNVDKEK